MDRFDHQRMPSPAATGAGPLSGTLVAVLTVMLVAGAWLRFNGTIAATSPFLAAPSGLAASQAGAGTSRQDLAELGLLPQSATAEAVASMNLSAGDAALLAGAVRRGRLRLIRMPIFDTGPAPLDAVPGREVTVSTAGYTRSLRVTRQPVVVTLPIGPAGTVLFDTASGDGVSLGALTLSGPIVFPPLPSGQQLAVGVIAQ